MIRGLYAAAAGMSAQLTRQDVISNNVANVDTPGFKKDAVVIESFPQFLLQRLGDKSDQVAAPVVGGVSLGSKPAAAITDFATGQLIPTQRAMDFAIQGRGFFAVQTPQGTQYTRHGSFAVSSAGFLVTPEGYRVIGENGPIEVSPETQMGAHGEVMVEGTIVNRILTVDIPAQDVHKQGENLFAARQGAQVFPLLEATITQGYLESSNVNVVKEMVNMLSGLRTYEANQRVLTMQDDSLGRLIETLGG